MWALGFLWAFPGGSITSLYLPLTKHSHMVSTSWQRRLGNVVSLCAKEEEMDGEISSHFLPYPPTVCTVGQGLFILKDKSWRCYPKVFAWEFWVGRNTIRESRWFMFQR